MNFFLGQRHQSDYSSSARHQSRLFFSIPFFGAIATVLLFMGACGGEDVGRDGELVGGSCQIAGDCEEDCLTGGDFPEGTCSVSCATDVDCPNGTNCIDKEGGTCLLSCDLPSDCRGGYTCKGKDNKGHGGESLVCFKD